MNRETGAAIDELGHIIQSVTDILETRIGTRVMRREYGSLIPELVDQPFNDNTRLRLYAATALALMRWEPRLTLSRVHFSGVTLQGSVVLDLEAALVDSNESFNLQVPLHLGAMA
ncbi:GPW/gp25 family protein [Pseudomonas laurylsulfatiphila]|uniref:GPW/gp25 family protein n=1 Tax=Pseudomonas laurylsulfatiphila TaxID=2011015 RepID=UPI00215E26DD|nr:GPW/gp25 family protein [Pseudomonas laurylsulfatiphila]UVM06415.1 GPW/gp25 family protein [Pseudomonas laurylsulfatiphila]